MKKILLLKTLIFAFISLNAQQWSGSLDLEGYIYRNGAIGINAGNDVNNPRINIGVTSSEAYIQHTYSNFSLPFNFKIGNNTVMKLDGEKMTYIKSDGSNNPRINIGATSSEVYIQHTYSNSSLPFNFKVGNSTIMRIQNGNIGIGTNNPGNYKLAVEGTIGAREVKVTLDSWSDFVFNDHYKLKKLDEVESYINNNNRLPDMPSESTVIENGVNLGQMDAKLLQKIEELTLYMIEMNKRVNSLETENSKLKEKIVQMETMQ